jgi:uncharacterized lipoprotein YddW (UPF0748 family)
MTIRLKIACCNLRGNQSISKEKYFRKICQVWKIKRNPPGHQSGKKPGSCAFLSELDFGLWTSDIALPMTLRILCVLAWLLPAALFGAEETELYRPAVATPPEPRREFRGAWVVALSVSNVDWPSRPGLTVAQQKAELASLLDRAVTLKLNAVLFQVRPDSDALYVSALEPWSEYLTGAQGQPPRPLYDPLAFAIAEAHRRGLELHAWFNPFRARDAQAKSPAAINHVSRTHPEWVRRYGDLLWLDPGEPGVRAHVLSVVLDVVRRYDVDGVVFDDYFYPYPLKNTAGGVIDFPDGPSWQQYGARSGLTRDNWRRQNINQFIYAVDQDIKAMKPWVKFGVSPFGIWRPGYPPPIKGLDAYAGLYADSRLWLAEGWVDYLAPQLAWPNEPPQQSFSTLLNWWAQQNVRGRALWPSLSAAYVGEQLSANDIARQIQLIRAQPGAGGEVFYHLRNLLLKPALQQVLQHEYTADALVPALTRPASTAPAPPELTIGSDTRLNLTVNWQPANGVVAWKWVFQFQTNNIWNTEILPAGARSWIFQNSKPDLISLRAVDRLSNESLPATLKKTVVPPRHTGKTVIMY